MINPTDIEETTEPTVTAKIKKLVPVCPFNLVKFYNENKGLVKKYLRKNTLNFPVPDWEDVPDDWFYKGQTGILKHGIHDRPYTTIQMLEWIKCGLDATYMTKKHVKIISIDEGLIPFNMYDFQEELVDFYQNNRFVISMQARQTGKTTTTAAYIMWFIIFSEAKTSAILANKADQAQEILSRIQLSYESLPLFLQPGVRIYNKRKVELEHHSVVFSAASSSSSIRGRSIALLYIDECAFIPGDMEFYESTYPTIASGKDSQVIVTSTPNGTRGLFYKLWQESQAGVNDFKQMLVTWDMVPGRDEEWKRQTIANTSPEQFRQEHECVTGDTEVSLKDDHIEINIALSDLYDIMALKDVNSGGDKYMHSDSIKELCMGKQGIVYKITRTDFKEYIGTTVDIKRRLYEHTTSDRFKEHQILDYEILYEGEYYDCLNKEAYFIDLYDTYKTGLNMTPSGRAKSGTEKFNTFGMTHSEDTKRRIGEKSKQKEFRKGWKHTEETKAKLSATRKGNVYRPLKISLEEAQNIINEYDNYTIRIEDAIDLLKITLRRKIESVGYNGETLIGKNGHVLDEYKVFSYVTAKKYNVTTNCIKAILSGKRNVS